MAIRKDETLEIDKTQNELVLRFTAGYVSEEVLCEFIDSIDHEAERFNISRVRFRTDDLGLKRSAKTYVVETSV